jgi:RNA polymerase sigma-70 factor, ECF subfamily
MSFYVRLYWYREFDAVPQGHAMALTCHYMYRRMSVMGAVDRKLASVESARARGGPVPHPQMASPVQPDDRAGEFARRFRESSKVLWLIAAGIVSDRTAAEDVVQEAALVGLAKIDQFKEGTNFTAWMGQMVRYVALNQARKNKHRRTAELDANSATVGASKEELALTARGDLPEGTEAFDDRVLHALRSLSETARCCLLLRTVQGLEYSEIAALLEIPEGTAMSHVHRSRNALRERLVAMEATRTKDPHEGNNHNDDPRHAPEEVTR